MEQTTNKILVTKDNSGPDPYGYEKVYSRAVQLDPSLSALVEQIRAIKPPRPGEVRTLLPKVKAGDDAARTRVIEMYTRNVLRIALSYAEQYGFPISDAFQDGLVELIQSVDDFDPSDIDKLQGFHSFDIRRRFLNRCINDLCSNRFSTYVLRQALDTVRAVCKREGRTILTEESRHDELLSALCQELQISGETVEDILSHAFFENSLDKLSEKCYTMEGETGITPYSISPDSVFKQVSSSCLRDSLDRSIQSIKKFPPRYKELLYLKFGLNDGTPKTLEEIASARHRTSSSVGLMFSKAIKRLRYSSKTAHLRDFLADTS